MVVVFGVVVTFCFICLYSVYYTIYHIYNTEFSVFLFVTQIRYLEHCQFLFFEMSRSPAPHLQNTGHPNSNMDGDTMIPTIYTISWIYTYDARMIMMGG